MKRKNEPKFSAHIRWPLQRFSLFSIFYFLSLFTLEPSDLSSRTTTKTSITQVFYFATQPLPHSPLSCPEMKITVSDGMLLDIPSRPSSRASARFTATSSQPGSRRGSIPPSSDNSQGNASNVLTAGLLAALNGLRSGSVESLSSSDAPALCSVTSSAPSARSASPVSENETNAYVQIVDPGDGHDVAPSIRANNQTRPQRPSVPTTTGSVLSTTPQSEQTTGVLATTVDASAVHANDATGRRRSYRRRASSTLLETSQSTGERRTDRSDNRPPR
jgi:hypothetical protein